MHANEAVRLVGNTIFPPGWNVQAMSYMDGMIILSYELRTYDSSVVTRSGQYTEPAHLAPATDVVDVRDLTADELLRKIVDRIQFINEHETREFVRTFRDGRWVAPFHPHNADGRRLWERTQLAKAA
jgi:hypothetical protein